MSDAGGGDGATAAAPVPRLRQALDTELTLECDTVPGAQSYTLQVAADTWVTAWAWQSVDGVVTAVSDTTGGGSVVRAVLPGLTPSTAYAARVVVTIGGGDDGASATHTSRVVRELCTVTPEVAAETRRAAHVAALKSECEALKAEVTRLTVASKAQKQQLTSFRVTFDGMTALRAQQDTLIADKERAEAALAAVTAAKDAEIAALKEQVAALATPPSCEGRADAATVRRLEADLADADARLERQYATFVTREAALVQEVEAVKANLARLTYARKQALTSASDAAQRAAELEEQLAHMQGVADRLAAERDEAVTAQRLLAATAASVAEGTPVPTPASAPTAALERALAQAVVQREAAVDRCRQLERDLEAANTRVAAAAADHDRKLACLQSALVTELKLRKQQEEAAKRLAMRTEHTERQLQAAHARLQDVERVQAARVSLLEQTVGVEALARSRASSGHTAADDVPSGGDVGGAPVAAAAAPPATSVVATSTSMASTAEVSTPATSSASVGDAVTTLLSMGFPLATCKEAVRRFPDDTMEQITFCCTED